MADRDNDPYEGDPIESILSPRGVFSQVIGGEIPIPGPVEPSRIHYPPFVENQLLMVQPMNLAASNMQTSADSLSSRESLQERRYSRDNFANQFLPRRQDEDVRIGSEQMPSGMERDFHQGVQSLMHEAQNPNIQLFIGGSDAHFGCVHPILGRHCGIGHLSAGRYEENLEHVLPSGRDTREGEDFISRRMPLKDYELQNSVVDVAKRLLLGSGENDPEPGDTNTASYLEQSGISTEYWKLYADKSSVNYDFAMNLMAYVELLNDSSWKETVSYFDEDVKRLIKHIWSERHVAFDNTIDLQRFNQRMILKLMLDFTEWSINRNFELEEFLNYCVLMCQLGFIGRKNIFKEAPVYAISQLQNRIKLLKFKHFAQFLLGIAVKERATMLMEHSRV